MTKAVQTASTKLAPTILFEDPHLIVLSKPAGLLSQGEHTGDENLVDWLRGYLGRPYVGLVHRLDRNTSGIMVVAKRTKSAQRLTLALQKDQVHRTYLGWVIGVLKNEVRWKHTLLKNSKTNTVQVVSKGGKESILLATPLHYGEWDRVQLTLMKFELETGRSHQIRVQSAYEGHPLLGDHKYGSTPKQPSFPRVALHSFNLEFPHPMSGEIMTFEAELPADLKQIKIKV
jgi:23S rRNA pseudouridine1911/1915/1917 synthase